MFLIFVHLFHQIHLLQFLWFCQLSSFDRRIHPTKRNWLMLWIHLYTFPPILKYFDVQGQCYFYSSCRANSKTFPLHLAIYCYNQVIPSMTFVAVFVIDLCKHCNLYHSIRPVQFFFFVCTFCHTIQNLPDLLWL